MKNKKNAKICDMCTTSDRNLVDLGYMIIVDCIEFHRGASDVIPEGCPFELEHLLAMQK